MSFQLIGAGSDLASTQTQMNKNILELKNNETTQIFKDDTGTRRVLLGKGENGFYGLKVSKDGEDVFTAGDDQLIFNSTQNVFKIVATDSVEWTPVLSSGIDTLTIDHNLGYVPIPQVFMTSVGGSRVATPLPYAASMTLGTADGTPTVVFQDYFFCSATDTSLNIYSYSPLSNPRPTRYFKYYLLQETAE
jgi:hypothetical protein